MIATDPVEESERAPARVTTRSHLRFAGALGVGAVAVLGVLQSAIGAFNPRPIVSVLIVAAVFFAGLWAQRIASRRAARTAAAARATQLREILGVWPPEALPDVDALRLGIYPRRRDTSADGPYVPRAIDDSLRDALQEGCVALVHGPARSGKSRTALEAISAARPGARILAPRGRRALADLLALDPPIDLGDVDTIVWLDGLERFAGTMDSLSLEGLMDLTHKSTVVMTVRASDWTRLLGASGDRGETARAVAAQARAFELPSALTDDERRAAQRTYPDIDFASGIGAGLAARGTESEPAPAHERVTVETVDPVPRGSRDPELVLPLAGAVAALAAFAAVWIFASFSTPVPKAIGEQVADIRHKFSTADRKAQHYVINLRGAQTDSAHYFRFYNVLGAKHPQSDTIAIYDNRHGKLERVFRFQPTGPPAVFRTRITRDVDADGNRDLVAGVSYVCRGPDGSEGCPRGGGMLPVVISWDDDTRRYRLVSINLGQPQIQLPVSDANRAQYGAYVRFTDPADKLSVGGHRVENFNVTKGNGPRLIAAYLTKRSGQFGWPRYELHAWQLLGGYGVAHVTQCQPRERGTIMDFSGRPFSVAVNLVSAWQAQRRNEC